MQIGFIGAGNMAGSMIHGMVANRYIAPENILVYDKQHPPVEKLHADQGIRPARSADALIDKADLLVLAVRPQDLDELLRETAGLIGRRGIPVVSIAAGVSLDSLRARLPDGCKNPLIRVMPSVNIQVGLSVSGICGDEYAGEEILGEVTRLLESVGTVVRLQERDFPAFTAIAGSAPAFVYLFIDALGRAGLQHGLPKAAATAIAANMVLGSAKMLLESGKHPWELADSVCSPGGTTVCGVVALEERGFPYAVIHAVDAVIRRERELLDETT